MSANTDVYWDDLGIAWRASVPDSAALTAQLGTRLRRQLLLTRIGDVFAAIVITGAFGLGAFIAWKGFLGGDTWRQGAVGLMVIILVVFAAVLNVWHLRGTRGNADNLAQMIDLTIARERRHIRGVRAAYLICVVMAAYMTAIWFIHPASGFLPVDVARRRLLGGIALAVVVCGGRLTWALNRGRRAEQNIAKFMHLKRVLGAPD